MFPGTGRPGTATSAVGMAAALIAAAAVAGCSSSSSSPPPASPASNASAPASASATVPVASPAPVSPAVTGASACAASSLQVKQGLAQGYAGGVYEVIDFTNTSASSCTLYGYPGVSLVSGPPYAQIGLAAKRDTTAPVKLITLAPGATANALLQIVDALNFTPSTCSPTAATDLRVYPPNQTAPVYLPNKSQGCAQPVQTLFISAVQAGSGGSS